jgi:asparagine synthase (glutamine-hydrolysing)
MCGIAGIVGPNTREPVRAMARTLVHRGPDADGFYDGDGVSLGARRLRIIDITGPDQPVFNEDRSVVTVFNGEIYNYRELRDFLEQKGHVFRTGGDTEVLVHLYEEFGDACVHALRGMFAFAIWDVRRRRLLVARDRIGIKPLYVAEVNGHFVFASELKAVVASGHVPLDMDPAALDFYLTLQYVPAPGTLLRHVRKLEPGHCLVWQDGATRVTRYWDIVLNSAEPRKRWSVLAEEFRHALGEAVKAHEVSDVPIGVLLSGGIDSSAVAALACRGDRRLQTFTIGFEHAPAIGELKQARAVAERLGSEHHEVVLGGNLAERLPRILWHLDEPVADVAAVPTYIICEFASRFVKVVMSGEGGDEVLGGYPRYRWLGFAERARAAGLTRGTQAAAPWFEPSWTAPRYLQHLRTLLDDQPLERKHIDWVRNFPAPERNRVLAEPSDPSRRDRVEAFIRDLIARSGARDVASALMYVDFKTWLPDNVLTKVDRMSMAVSIEARVPYLDHRLVEFAAAMPGEWKMRRAGRKWLLHDAVRQHLPASTRWRRKRAFLTPVSSWLRRDLSDFTYALLGDKRCVERGVFNPARVRELLDEHRAGRADHGQALWNLVSLELWLQQVTDVPSLAAAHY